jgi:hypothetical protein
MANAMKRSNKNAAAPRSDQDLVYPRGENWLREMEAHARNSCEADGQINSYTAVEIAYEALSNDILPPLIVREWLMKGFSDYLQSHGSASLDKALRLTANGKGKGRPNERAFLKKRNEIYADLFFFLTSHGATVAHAATLIWARDKFLRSCSQEALKCYPKLSTEDRAVETLTKYWNSTWRKIYRDEPLPSVSGYLPPAPEARLMAAEDCLYGPGEAELVWYVGMRFGWPAKELAEARKGGLRI